MIAETRIADLRTLVNDALDRWLPASAGPERVLADAMRYAVLGEGKRLRPVLVLASCAACGGERRLAVDPAAAIEMVHAYSLVHDDLPAMDDDDLRRGRPTVHRVFGEAAAILAGDALLTLAFEILGSSPAGDGLAPRRAEAVLVVARAAGRAGMVGGQQADLDAEGRNVDAARLEWIHRHKTGALLSASAEVGAILAGAAAPHRSALARYGAAVGLAFQIADDVLDVTSSAAELGKTPGKDRRARKATYPALLGLEASRAEALRCVERALDALSEAGIRDDLLEHLARFAASRAR